MLQDTDNQAMPDYNTISTEHWQILLPCDWVQKPQTDGSRSFYFEASDGTKGAYISVFTRTNPCSSALADLATWRDTEIRNLHAMTDHHWEIIEEWQHDESETAISASDCLERSTHYRIVCLRMTQFPWLVRVSLHDYNCTDYETSKQAFLPLIDSFAPVFA